MYERRQLSLEQAREAYQNALVQGEAAELNAWLNYLRARVAQEAVRADLERLEALPTRNNLPAGINIKLED